jgi:hypothetical protein
MEGKASTLHTLVNAIEKESSPEVIKPANMSAKNDYETRYLQLHPFTIRKLLIPFRPLFVGTAKVGTETSKFFDKRSKTFPTSTDNLKFLTRRITEDEKKLLSARYEQVKANWFLWEHQFPVPYSLEGNDLELIPCINAAAKTILWIFPGTKEQEYRESLELQVQTYRRKRPLIVEYFITVSENNILDEKQITKVCFIIGLII